MGLIHKIERPKKKHCSVISPEHCPPPMQGEMWLGVKAEQEEKPKVKKKSMKQLEREAIDLRVSVAKESLAKEVQRQQDMIGSIPF